MRKQTKNKNIVKSQECFFLWFSIVLLLLWENKTKTKTLLTFIHKTKTTYNNISTHKIFYEHTFYWKDLRKLKTKKWSTCLIMNRSLSTLCCNEEKIQDRYKFGNSFIILVLFLHSNTNHLWITPIVCDVAMFCSFYEKHLSTTITYNNIYQQNHNNI